MYKVQFLKNTGVFSVHECINSNSFQNRPHFLIKNTIRYQSNPLHKYFNMLHNFLEACKKFMFIKYQTLKIIVRIFYKKSYLQGNEMYDLENMFFECEY